MESTVKLIKGNREISVFDFEVKEYLSKGYSFLKDEDKVRFGKGITETADDGEKLRNAEEKIAGLCSQVEELTEENKNLSDENAKLKAECLRFAEEIETLKNAQGDNENPDDGKKATGKKSDKAGK